MLYLNRVKKSAGKGYRVHLKGPNRVMVTGYIRKIAFWLSLMCF